MNPRYTVVQQFVPIIVFILGVSSPGALSQTFAPTPILPDSIRWVSPPNLPGLHAAWLLGGEKQPGAYILRVKLVAGTLIPPHTHPDERNTTVLAGTIFVGFGETFGEANVVAVPAGAVYVAPADVPHYVWARDGDAVYQEAGIGPTGSVFIRR